RLTRHDGGRVALLDAPRKIDNGDFFLYFTLRSERPVIQVLRYPGGESFPGRFMYKIRAHGGFDLNPLFRRLRAEFPGAQFGGRSAAGGSRVAVAIDDAALVALAADESMRAPAESRD